MQRHALRRPARGLALAGARDERPELGGGHGLVLLLVGDHRVDEGGGLGVHHPAQPLEQVVGDTLSQVGPHRLLDR